MDLFFESLQLGNLLFNKTVLFQFANYFKVYAPDFLDFTIDKPRRQEDVKPLSEYKNMETKFEVLRELFGEAIK